HQSYWIDRDIAVFSPVENVVSEVEVLNPSNGKRQIIDTDAIDQNRWALRLVRSAISSVLGYSASDTINLERTFLELGFNSVSIVELRDRLNAATGMSLPTTIAFDFPTPGELVEYLLAAVSGGLVRVPVCSVVPVVGDVVVVVGMGCRYPGGVGSPEELWDLV